MSNQPHPCIPILAFFLLWALVGVAIFGFGLELSLDILPVALQGVAYVGLMILMLALWYVITVVLRDIFNDR